MTLEEKLHKEFDWMAAKHIKFLEHQYNQAYKKLDFETAEEFYRIKEILSDVNRLTQAEFNGALEQVLKSVWAFVERNRQSNQLKVEIEVKVQIAKVSKIINKMINYYVTKPMGNYFEENSGRAKIQVLKELLQKLKASNLSA